MIHVRHQMARLDDLPKCEHGRIPGFCRCWQERGDWRVETRQLDGAHDRWTDWTPIARFDSEADARIYGNTCFDSLTTQYRVEGPAS